MEIGGAERWGGDPKPALARVEEQLAVCDFVTPILLLYVTIVNFVVIV